MTKGRIVIVEDETIVARDIQATLQSFGYEVPEVVTSGEEAIQAAFRLNPDLMIMDIMIKGSMDGVDAAEIIRSQFNLPIVYLTAYSDDETLRRAKLTESYGFIAKPFDERELFVAVEFALYKHQMNNKMLESKSWIESALRCAPEALVAVDKEENVFLLNTLAESLLNSKEIVLKGKPLKELFPDLPLYDGKILESLVKYRNPVNSDVLVPLVVKGNFIRNEKGAVLGRIFALRTQTL